MVNQSKPLLTAALAGLGVSLQPLELVRQSLWTRDRYLPSTLNASSALPGMYTFHMP